VLFRARPSKGAKRQKKGNGSRGSSYAQQVAHEVVPRFDPVHEVRRDAELRRAALHFLFFGSLRRLSSFCVVFVLLFFWSFCSFVLLVVLFFCSFVLVVLFARFAFSGCFARFEKKKKRKKKKKEKKRKKNKKSGTGTPHFS
jgi:ABC-type multidrug transport system fused ATPase/permease subunit